MLVIKCSVCAILSGFTNYDIWLDHLLTDNHQKNIEKEITNWDAEKNSRAVVFAGFCLLGGEIIVGFPEFLQYVSKQGMVSDFYFCNKSKYCVTLIIDKTDVENIVKMTHVFNNHPLEVYLKATLTSEKWTNIKESLPQQAALCESVSKLKSSSLEHQLSFFLSNQPFNDYDRTTQSKVVADLTSVLRDEFPNCRFFPCGNKYAHEEPGKRVFNMVLYSRDDTKYKNISQVIFKRKLAAAVENGLNMFCSVKLQKQPSVLICQHASTNITCHIEFNWKIGIYLYRLLSFLEQYDPRVQPLITLISYWANYYKLNVTATCEKPWASKKAKLCDNNRDPFILLVLFFLMQCKILPPIISLHQSPQTIFNVDDGRIDFNGLIQEMRRSFVDNPAFEANGDTLKPTAVCILKLARDFFKFYESVEFGKYVLSLPLGRFVEKAVFGENPNFALTMKPYNFPTFLVVAHGWVNTPLSVQDPCNVYDNVTDLISQTTLNKFVSLCHLTGNALDDMLTNNSTNPQFTDIFNPQFLPKEELENLVATSSNQPAKGQNQVLAFERKPKAPQANVKKNDDGTHSTIIGIDGAYREHSLAVIRQLATEAGCLVDLVKSANALWYCFIEDMLDRVWTDGFICTVRKETSGAAPSNNSNAQSNAKKIKLEPGSVIQERLRELQSMECARNCKYIVRTEFNAWRTRNNIPHSENIDPIVTQKRITETVILRKKAKTLTMFECSVEFGGGLIKLFIRNTPPSRPIHEQKHGRHFSELDMRIILTCLGQLSRNYPLYKLEEWAVKMKQ